MTDPLPLLLDSHALATSRDRSAYPLAADVEPPSPAECAAERDCEEILGDLAKLGSGRAVLVQRNRYYGYDNSYVREMAGSLPDRLRAVCALNTLDPVCGAHAQALLGRPGVAGVRLMEPSRQADLAWLDGEASEGLWSCVADRGALAQVHFFPWSRQEGITRLCAMLDRYPLAVLVMDNLTNIDLTDPAGTFGIDDVLARLVEHACVHMRFTSLALFKCAGAGIDTGDVISRLVGLCGADRLLWGSDIMPPGMEYRAAAQLGVHATRKLQPHARDALLHGNAGRLFFGDGTYATPEPTSGEQA